MNKNKNPEDMSLLKSGEKITRESPLRSFKSTTDSDANKVKELNESLELKIKERTAELSEANKELETFNYTVSHDLRAPLRSITGFSKILLKEHSEHLNTEAKEMLEIIEASALRMNNLVHNLLKFSQVNKTGVVRESTNMDQLVAEVLSEMKAEIKDLKTEICIKELHQADCDPLLMKQVWMNLVNNAVKYSSKKNAPVVEVGMKEENGNWAYYVRDNGAGFNMEYAERLFKPFQRLHSGNDFEGTGVGLATAQRIIEKHGGRIWAESRENEGATFYFTLSAMK